MQLAYCRQRSLLITVHQVVHTAARTAVFCTLKHSGAPLLPCLNPSASKARAHKRSCMPSSAPGAHLSSPPTLLSALRARSMPAAALGVAAWSPLCVTCVATHFTGFLLAPADKAALLQKGPLLLTSVHGCVLFSSFWRSGDGEEEKKAPRENKTERDKKN